jgi:hypothetical protein
MTKASPFTVAVILLVALPLAAWTQSGHRLAVGPDGGLILVRTNLWGWRERKLADLDGRAGWWQVRWADGRTELWDGNSRLGGAKLSAKVSASH